MYLFATFFLFVVTLTLPPEPLVLEAPDSAFAKRLVWAQAQLDKEQICQPQTRCDDVAINVLALNSLGRFDLARPSLVRMAERTDEWVVAAYDYWLGSADHAFVREQWGFIPQPRTAEDGGVHLAAITALAALARAQNDTAMLARANALLTSADREAQARPGIVGPALGLLDADKADAHLRFIADSVHARWPLGTGLVALAFYEYHREADGFALLRSMAKSELSSAAMYVLPLIRGLIGWDVDAPNRALAVEPHVPASWKTVSVSNLKVGTHEVDFKVEREARTYRIQLSKETNTPLSIRLAPALPRGVRVLHVTVNESDAPIHVEETPHDTHVVIETSLRRELLVEIEYEMPRTRRSP